MSTATWEIRPEPGPGTQALVIPVCTGQLPGEAPAAFLAATGFTGDLGDVAQLPGRPGEPATVLLGLGPAPAGRDAVRTAAAGLARVAAGYPRLAVHAPAGELLALVEGYLLGGYRFTRHRSAATAPQEQIIDVLVPDTTENRDALRAGQRRAEAVRLARDLVNEPGGELTPEDFAQQAMAVAKASGLECEVWEADRIADERLGGLLGVSRGSLEPPRLVKLSYRPVAGRRRIALVGKGVTFDAGGISLKPTGQMVDMKADMAGAAAVLGAMSVLADLDCPVAVDGWLPLTENMPNANPTRVGDVLVMRNGTTVEVRNADAEGRLIMADALILAGETQPDAIIDLGTLTDAAPVALGREIAAVLGNDDALTERLRAAGEAAGEPLWPLPLPQRYRHQIDSRVADLVNLPSGLRHGVTLHCGLFLQEFVPAGIAWGHLDIQGTAICDADQGEWTAGGTGFGVRLLIDLLMAGA